MWSHDGQKHRFVIFGRGSPKMGKKSSRKTIGVKVRSEILSPGQNFLFWHILCDVTAWHSAECHPCTLVAECHPGTSDSLRNFTSMVPKVSLQDFLPILGVARPKIMNRSFWLSCDQMVLLNGVRPKPGFGPFEVRPWIKFSKFWPGETSDLYANGPKSFLPGFFTYFRRPMAKITDRSFWPLCDQNLCLVFLTIVRPEKASKICETGMTEQLPRISWRLDVWRSNAQRINRHTGHKGQTFVWTNRCPFGFIYKVSQKSIIFNFYLPLNSLQTAQIAKMAYSHRFTFGVNNSYLLLIITISFLAIATSRISK